MTPALLLTNIGAFALQLAAVIGVGLALSLAVQVGRPRAALVYWRLVLLACLLLPLAQPWTAAAPPPGPVAAVSTPIVRDGAPGVALDPIETSRTRWAATELVLIALAIGIAARGLWLLVGAAALVRLRRTATTLEPVPAAFAEAQARLGVRATIAVADSVSGPITFGLVRPIVIVPPSVLELGPDVQEAIACHELLHVRRRDWVDEIAEEVIRTVFWFHPAMWWLVDRIQLSREQVVDQEAIALTASRERYVRALVSVALARRSIALEPAPLFLRRSHLKQRITRILQETTMTTRRLIASLTLSSAAIALAAVLAVRAFPLQAEAPPSGPSSDPVSIVKGGDHLLHAALPEYPRRAIEQKVEGDVLLEATLDERGEVADARVLSGPDELRKASLESVLNWHYSPAALRSISTEVTLRFRLPAPDVEIEEKARASQEERTLAYKVVRAHELKEIAPDREPGESVFSTSEPPRLVQVRSERVSNEVLRAVMARSGVKIGDTMDETAAKRFAETAASVDEHLRVNFRSDGKGGLVIVLLL
jgi:TonB family protein